MGLDVLKIILVIGITHFGECLHKATGREAQEMNKQQAMELLGILPEDDSREVKRKYHKMISRFHPDTASEQSEEKIRRAQEINEAYQILRTVFGTENKKSPNKWTANSGSERNRATTDRMASWSEDSNPEAFSARNIYVYYAMDITEEEKKHATENLFYQVARGKYIWDPKDEEFPLFLTSIRHATQELLEKAEGEAKKELKMDLSEISRLKEQRFLVQARLFEYLSLQYIDPVKALKFLAKPESTDVRGQKTYHFRAFLAGERTSEEGRALAVLKEKEFLYPRTFHGNQIQIMNEKRQILGYLHMEDDRLYFCLIPLLKKQAARVKLLVRTVPEKKKRGGSKVKVDVDFYFRLEEEKYWCDSGELNRKIEDVIKKYREYLSTGGAKFQNMNAAGASRGTEASQAGRRRASGGAGSSWDAEVSTSWRTRATAGGTGATRNAGTYQDLFARLARSNFRSRFHLKAKDLQYIQDKGLDTIRSHACDFVRQRLAPAEIPNDGKQTPMRGHPVFLAQHATGCCCRGCLFKWHRIPQGTQLTQEQQEYVVNVLMEWIRREIRRSE